MPNNKTKKNRPQECNTESALELRRQTGAGMMDCKKAIALNDGDLEKAKAWLESPRIFCI